MYESAVEKQPNNENLLSQLFMSYVREQDYVKQKATAMSLYKLIPKNHYYFWGIMSVYMQAITSRDQSVATKIMLPVAEGMCRKHFNDGKFESSAEFELYQMILKKQQKYNELLELLNNPITKSKLADTLRFEMHTKAKAYKILNRQQESFDTMLEIIKDCPEQLAYYCEAFEIAKSIDSSSQSEEQHFKCTLQLHDLIEQFLYKTPRNENISLTENEVPIENPKSLSRKSRTVFMAKIMVFASLLKTCLEEETKQKVPSLLKRIPNLLNDGLILEMIYDFFLDFGHKFAFIQDVMFLVEKKYLSPEHVSLPL